VKEVDWASLERAAASLGHSEEAHALAEAIRNRDIRRATELLEQIKRDSGAQPPGDRSFAQVARPMRERAGQADAGTGRDLMSALGEIFRAQINQVGLDPDKSAENNLKRAMQAAEQRAAQSNSRRPPPRQHPDNANNSGRGRKGAMMATLVSTARTRATTPVAIHRQPNAPGSTSRLSAAADGRNPADVEQSRSLAAIAAAPVDGPKTLRLQAQLQRVRIDGQQSGDAANVGARSGSTPPPARSDRALTTGRWLTSPLCQGGGHHGRAGPLAHRAVVRDYFLNLRRMER